MPFPVAAAIAAGASIAGQGIQSSGAAARNRKQYFIQKKLMDLTESHNKSLALFNNKQQMEMWKQTGPTGQMEQLKLAGLNPGLIYGMGGAGGQTAQAAQAQGMGTPQADVENIAQGMGITGQVVGQQLALMKAQKENIEADTANKKGEANNQPIKGQNIQASTENIIQDTSNKKAQEALTNTQNNIAQIERQIKTDTQADVTDQITNVARQASEQLQILQNENAITSEEAINARQTATQHLISLQLQNEINRKNLTLTDEQIQKLKADIENQTNLANLQLKINDLPKSVQTIIQTIFSILHYTR